MSPLAQTVVVFRKELRDAARDRRSIYAILIGSLFGPLIMWWTFTNVANRQRAIDDVRIPVVGIEHAPALIDWLRQQAGVEIVTGPADAEAAVRDRREDVIVVIPADFTRKFRSSSPAQVKIVSDGSRDASRPKVTRVRALFQRYSGEIGVLRLVSRGVSPAIATPLQLEDVEVSSGQQRAARLLAFLPMFIVIAAFTGGMQIAMDATAGERERGSLEPLLVNPVPRGAVAAGKWFAAACAAMISVVITTGLVLTLLRQVPLQELGIRFRLGQMEIAALLGALLPMCLLSTGLQTYLATFARSFKEAQSYVSIMMIFPMLPGFLTTMYPMTTQSWMYLIPVFGQQVLAGDVLGAKATPWWAFVLAAGGALIVAVVLVQLTTQLLRRERIIFSR